MYFVAGSNVFGQWLKSDNNKILRFTKCFHANNKEDYCEFEIQSARVVSINWSFNIYHHNSTFYAVGAWKGLDKQCKQVPIEEDYNNVLIAANDHFIFIVNKTTMTIKCLNLETEEIKTLNLKLESSAEATKKPKIEDSILKVSVANNSVLYLTSQGYVYHGLVPSYVDTSHCTGKVIDVQCGYEHYLLHTDEELVYSWGNGRRLQLGHGDVNNEESPTLVEALAGIKIKQISAGGWHSLALSEFGDLYAWGWNDTGQLGIYEMEKQSLNSYGIPTLVDLYVDGNESNCNIIDIACGTRHSAILLDDKSIWTSGCNKYGQLGTGGIDSSQCFKKVFHNENVHKLMCGPWTTVAITE